MRLYTSTARAFLGQDVDLHETYDWGWSELDRIADEAELLATELHPDGFDAAVRMLDADTGRSLPTARIEPWLTERLSRVADHVDSRHLDLPPPPHRVPECRMTTAASGVMYYDPPGADLARPGRVWWTVDPAVGARTWREATTLHHEGVPGHHTQIVTAMTTPGLHPWQRHLCEVHGHAEGWAHWAEAWAAEIGLSTTPPSASGCSSARRGGRPGSSSTWACTSTCRSPPSAPAAVVSPAVRPWLARPGGPCRSPSPSSER